MLYVGHNVIPVSHFSFSQSFVPSRIIIRHAYKKVINNFLNSEEGQVGEGQGEKSLEKGENMRRGKENAYVRA